jgi:hypothetical protein
MSSSSESILDHIADYLKFISGAQSFWFMLNTSYNHDCHLASRFRLEPNNYEVLLVVAGLASYTRFSFAIKPTAWGKFLSGHRFAAHNCAIELEQKKMGGVVARALAVVRAAAIARTGATAVARVRAVAVAVVVAVAVAVAVAVKTAAVAAAAV